jgi:hypothetical protein
MLQKKIARVDIDSSGIKIKDLPENRLMVLGAKNGKELGMLIDTNNPDSWRACIERFIKCLAG